MLWHLQAKRVFEALRPKPAAFSSQRNDPDQACIKCHTATETSQIRNETVRFYCSHHEEKVQPVLENQVGSVSDFLIEGGGRLRGLGNV